MEKNILLIEEKASEKKWNKIGKKNEFQQFFHLQTSANGIRVENIYEYLWENSTFIAIHS